MLKSDVMEKRIATCLEAASERQPILFSTFIEIIAYYRKRIAYLEALNKEQQGYINIIKNNGNPAYGIIGGNIPHQATNPNWKL